MHMYIWLIHIGICLIRYIYTLIYICGFGYFLHFIRGTEMSFKFCQKIFTAVDNYSNSANISAKLNHFNLNTADEIINP